MLNFRRIQKKSLIPPELVGQSSSSTLSKKGILPLNIPGRHPLLFLKLPFSENVTPMCIATVLLLYLHRKITVSFFAPFSFNSLSYLLLLTAMDALPSELIGPIVESVNPKSLANLKEILHPDTPWSLSVDHAQASRFDVLIIVKYLIGSDRIQLHLAKKFLHAPEWTYWRP
uniref:Uncharacterized protein n=1 Tax=Steinernema glaseri TaxID=37863 RepID=A0A1I7ZTQ8_9BILA